ncbi:MAG: peptidylprolyl isomerase [Clostridia bacterium]|nr:peptidylprolyl isomerase [Clostridia bacterium]
MSSKILATVNGWNITDDDVYNEISQLGERGKKLMNEQGMQIVLDQLINRKLILAGAKHDMLEFDKEYKSQLALLKDELLTKYAISKTLSGVTVSDDEAKKYYNEHINDFTAEDIISASHILTDNEEQLVSLRDKIIDGSITFENAARKYSKCPSSENGGSLGEFGRGQMVKEFEDAAFGLEIGEISQPVHTQFGYHLIRLDGKSDSKTYSFDEIKDQLKAQLLQEKQQKAYQSRINQLKILFPVDRY